MKHVNTQLMTELLSELNPFQDAVEFVILYRNYVHAIDDLVDVPHGSEEILRVSALANQVFNSDFWRQYGPQLQVLEYMINNTYADSVKWENSEKPEFRVAADTLRHAALDMFYAVLLIKLGRDKLREFSLRFREQCYNIQSCKEDIK